MRERLQKIVARAGVASRRTAEALIRAGAIRVNGHVVTELGSKADPEKDRIEVDGRLLKFPERALCLLLNKPRGTVCTAHDPKGRPTVFHLLRGVRERLFVVGRLSYDVEGLLLLTNDGDFSDLVQRGRLTQTYGLKVKGRLDAAAVARLERLAGRHQRVPLRLRMAKSGANPWYEVCLREPRADWLQTALFRLGHPVEKVKRLAIGSLRDNALRAGEFRELRREERARLEKEVAAGAPATAKRARLAV